MTYGRDYIVEPPITDPPRSGQPIYFSFRYIRMQVAFGYAVPLTIMFYWGRLVSKLLAQLDSIIILSVFRYILSFKYIYMYMQVAFGYTLFIQACSFYLRIRSLLMHICCLYTSYNVLCCACIIIL